MKLEFSEEQYKTIKQLLDMCANIIDEEEYEHLELISIKFLVDEEIERKSRCKDEPKGFDAKNRNSKLPF